MESSEMLVMARARAGLSQRELGRRTGVAQPTIARIERGQVEPRVSTLVRLLDECGERLTVEPIYGRGVDRSQMRELLRLSPKRRIELLSEDAANLDRFDRLVVAGRVAARSEEPT